MMTENKVIVIGAGLVGSLAAISMSRMGYSVHVYEKRSDFTRNQGTTISSGRSINLALSERGIDALKGVGLDQTVVLSAGPIIGRMMHPKSTDTYPVHYGSNNEVTSTDIGIFSTTNAIKCIYSIGRTTLNEILVEQLQKEKNVSINYDCKLLEISNDFLTFTNEKVSIKEDTLILACDGAYSKVRKQLSIMGKLTFDYQSSDLAYKELCIPANNEDGSPQISNNYLHVWPRKSMMLIALPNADKTFTVTLFMPGVVFKRLKTSEDVCEFFLKEYPEVLKLVGEKRLVKDFLSNVTCDLVTSQVSEYHYKDQYAFLGDAAHSMLPFYGQGMNAAFEDVTVFMKLLNLYPSKDAALKMYSELRVVDGEAICELSRLNYYEMNPSIFVIMTRHLMGGLHRLFPKIHLFDSEYELVAFTLVRYSHILQLKRSQKLFAYTVVIILAAILYSIVGILL